MSVSDAQKQALKRYSQSDKGRAALQRAHEKRAKTEEYREYQRQKQAEYRRRRKAAAVQGEPSTSDSPATEVGPFLSVPSQSSPQISKEAMPTEIQWIAFQDAVRSLGQLRYRLCNIYCEGRFLYLEVKSCEAERIYIYILDEEGNML